MRKMKDSGIEWIGEIPEDWEVAPLKNVCKEFYSGGTPTASNSNYYTTPERGLPFINISDLTNNKYVEKSEKYITPDAVNSKNLKLVNENYILFAMYASTGTVSMLSINSYISQAILAIRTNKKLELGYLYYFLESFKPYSESYSRGTTQNNLSAEIVKNLKITIPNLLIQRSIIESLNKITKRLVSIKETIIQEIHTLEEYKKSVITEAVTKGLDKNAEMKDSGIEWIGAIPIHWKVIRIKNAALLKARIGWQGLKSDEFLDQSDLPFLVTGTDFKNGYVDWDNCVRISEKRFEMDKNIQIKDNDLLITKDGTIGKLAIARNCPEKASLNSGVFVIRNQGPYKYFDKYMYYLLQSQQFLLWFELCEVGNSTIRHLYQREFYNFSFTYPPINEQEEIANHLDEKCGAIDEVIAIKQNQLSLLDEYKKSLIYEYVTGKREV